MKNNLYSINLFDAEHDSCAIIALVRKNGVATHGNVRRVLRALDNMGHRTGEINQEGDGTGIQTDIPKLIWGRKLELNGLDSRQVYNPLFTVLHLMIRRSNTDHQQSVIEAIRRLLSGAGYDVIHSAAADVDRDALGPRGLALEPLHWQMAMVPHGRRTIAEAKSHELHLKIEKLFPDVHVVSFSQNSVIYKVRGDVRTLMNYFPELKHPDFRSAISLGHGRYSTNTESTHERAQMFSTLGHNGEINTIMRLRKEAQRLGIQLVENGSDSQDLDRMVENLMFREDFSLMEAMEMIFPPVWSEINKMEPKARELYTHFRRVIGKIAQGPAAIIARQGDEIVFSVDALGLRPLWYGETDKEFYASSEKGVIDFESMESDPVPIAPGEKKGIWLKRPIVVGDSIGNQMIQGGVEVFSHQKLRDFVVNRVGGSIASAPTLLRPARESGETSTDCKPVNVNHYMAMGWKTDEWDDISCFMSNGKEPIAATGYDGPLAFLVDDITNIPEYIKERVAVVTNPSIDREREGDHFSLRTFIGPRPGWRDSNGHQLLIDHPVLVGGLHNDSWLSAHSPDLTLADVLRDAGKHLDVITVSLSSESEFPTESDYDRKIDLITHSLATSSGAVLVLDDRSFFTHPTYAFDPFVFLAKLNRALDAQTGIRGRCLRLECSIILVSGQLRTTHDLIVALGLGADALVPYLAYERALENQEGADKKVKLITAAMVSGIEKVISTLGIHDISGYAPLFAAIGLKHDLAKAIGITNALGHDQAGYGFGNLTAALSKRKEALEKDLLRLKPDSHLYPKVWKSIADVAQGKQTYQDYLDKLRKVTEKTPVGIRHLLDIETGKPAAESCDVSIDGYDGPFYISAMSFGSQGEISYKAYAEAAARENLVCMNGEGGELPEIMGKYYRNRGQQVASGRFGVNATLLNSARFIEIKIGQGAKPGEGGHLPGFKVTAKIAEARHTNIGVDLISPSNNHDIYSIEDLAQLIEELKTVNPFALISVKIPAIPNIGPIATGVAKASADVIAISGFDGGTGAARRHSLKYVGFPTELALFESHQALVQSGLRDKVELWADGGVKSSDDILKLMALGANRVGLGTLAMVSIGCTICRDCNTGTCHVGITAHFPTQEAAFSAGLTAYEPRNYDLAVQHLSHMLQTMKSALAEQGAALGFRRLQDLVGQNHLLKQSRAADKIDLRPLTLPVPGPVSGAHRDSDWFMVQKPKTGLSKMIGETLIRTIERGQEKILYRDDRIANTDRAVGAATSGELSRQALKGTPFNGEIFMDLTGGSIPGNGLGSFINQSLRIRIQGGVQDGSAKGASGGRMTILKGLNHNARTIDGSVGKCFAYGAQAGRFFVQGYADSRTCIRLSGAEVVFGKRITDRYDLNAPADVLAHAALKGFAFEYMTSGTVLVLGDPGPWMCSGMTGGIVYFRLYPELGLTVDGLKKRLASNAKINFRELGDSDVEKISELLTDYRDELIDTGAAEQQAEARLIEEDLASIRSLFVAAIPAVTPVKKPEIAAEPHKH
ncbi:MAG: alpha-hydroxy-acid oxidizing protein [Bacteroidetes bacterium]|nr:alpha-hydroxy-acid oxidizing protein [Bacteroidota bacterium]